MNSVRPPYEDANKCPLPLLDGSGSTITFDIQSAEPGAFISPGVVELETYEPGSIVHTVWVYFKGDPWDGPIPDHPFDGVYEGTKFTIDLVSDDGAAMVLQQVMRRSIHCIAYSCIAILIFRTAPTNSSVFWESFTPFGHKGNHTLAVPDFDSSCKYQRVGIMDYRWTAPTNLDQDSAFRLKLATDVPATTHLSARFRVAPADAAPLPPMDKAHPRHAGLSAGGIVGIVLAVIAAVLLAGGLGLWLRRRSRRITIM